MIDLLKYEESLLAKGNALIAGVDEAGRGPLAGPVVVAAVILKPGVLAELIKIKNASEKSKSTRKSDVRGGLYLQINDSKKVGPKKRAELYEFIISESFAYSVAEKSEKEIDEQGIMEVTLDGFYEAIQKLKHEVHAITDFYKIPKLSQSSQTNLVSGDRLSLSVAAASIIAKVHRDNIMVKMHQKYPKYGFDRHKGYGTKAHREAILKYGPCVIHRKSFKLH